MGNYVRKTRRTLGLTQKDLERSGIERSVISRIERGEIELSVEHAIKLSDTMNLIIRERCINIKLEVNPALLLGQKEDGIDRLVSNLQSNKEYAFHEIDEFLAECPDELGEELINRIYNEVLIKEMYKYKREIRKYSSKFFEYIKGEEKVTKAYVRLIGATMLDDDAGKYKRIVDYSESTINGLKHCTDIEKLKFYHNVSIACRNVKEYAKGLEMIEKAKKIENNPYELKMLNNEAVIYIKQERYKKAINIYKEIKIKSDNANDTANSDANIADIYNTIGKLELANEYIVKAFKLVDEVNMHYRYNLNYVKLQIEMKQNFNIYETLENTLICTKQLNDKVKTEKILSMVTDYYINEKEKFSDIIKILHKNEIPTQSLFLMDILPFIVNEEVRKMVFEIPRY